jgi:hypothetical protein
VALGDDTPPITVFSPVNMSAAIVGQQLTPGATTSTVDLAYVVHYPYQVAGFEPILKVTNNYGNIASARLIQPNGEPYPSTIDNAPKCNGTGGPGKGDYTVRVP